MTDVSNALLAGDDRNRALRRLIRHARETQQAAGAWVCLPTSDESTWQLALTEGMYTAWQDATVPLQGSATGAAIAADDLVVIADPVTDERGVPTGG